ncbi:MAG: hypothetical protein LBH00_06810 [Planctomycetaceae bacterium]|jgi:hypothetical protein|nr:hypothetical protein [Planctomycetaceae bacterium]
MQNIQKILRLPLFWVMLVLFTEFIINFDKWSKPFLEDHGIDPKSYIEASYNVCNILHGDVDLKRPFVYPALIALCRTIAGDKHALALTVVLQRLIGIASIAIFYLLCQFFLKTKYLAVLPMVFYAVLTIFMRRFDTWIMTEPLSMSLTIFLTYGFLLYSQRTSYLKALPLGFSAFFLVMLRPAFLVFVPFIFLFFIGQFVFFRKNWRRNLTGLAAAVLSVLGIFGYSVLVERECGVRTVSIISFYNLFMCEIQSGITDNGSNLQINQRIHECLEEFKQKYPDKIKKPNWMFDREVDTLDSPLGYVRRTYPFIGFAGGNDAELIKQANATLSIKTVRDYTKNTLMRNKLAYAKYLARKMYIVSLSEIRIGVVYAVLAVSVAVLLFSLRTHSLQINWLHFMIWGMTFAMVFVSMAASFTSYGRIILPVLSLSILQAFLIFDRLLLLLRRQKTVSDHK